MNLPLDPQVTAQAILATLSAAAPAGAASLAPAAIGFLTHLVAHPRLPPGFSPVMLTLRAELDGSLPIFGHMGAVEEVVFTLSADADPTMHVAAPVLTRG